MANATPTRTPTAPRCVEHAENRRRFVERIVDVLRASAAKDGEPLSDVALKLEDGTYSWHVLATLAKERNVDPDEETRRQIIHALRILGGVQAEAAAAAKTARTTEPSDPELLADVLARSGLAQHAALRARAKRIVDRMRGADIETVVATIRAMGDEGLAEMVRAEDDARRSYAEDRDGE